MEELLSFLGKILILFFTFLKRILSLQRFASCYVTPKMFQMMPITILAQLDQQLSYLICKLIIFRIRIVFYFHFSTTKKKFFLFNPRRHPQFSHPRIFHILVSLHHFVLSYLKLVNLCNHLFETFNGWTSENTNNIFECRNTVKKYWWWMKYRNRDLHAGFRTNRYMRWCHMPFSVSILSWFLLIK